MYNLVSQVSFAQSFCLKQEFKSKRSFGFHPQDDKNTSFWGNKVTEESLYLDSCLRYEVSPCSIKINTSRTCQDALRVHIRSEWRMERFFALSQNDTYSFYSAESYHEFFSDIFSMIMYHRNVLSLLYPAT